MRLPGYLSLDLISLRSPVETLKKQASQQGAEFDRLATKYNEATGGISNKRSD